MRPASGWTGRWTIEVALLLDLANRLDALQDAFTIADTIDSGVPIGVTRMFAAALPEVVRGAAAQARTAAGERILPSPGGDAHVLRIPWGPAAVLAPFNAPAFTAVKKTAYALAAGCPVVLKPSPDAPHAAAVLATAMAGAVAAHGAPRALFQLVHGDADAGAQLAGDKRIRCLTFTGSRRAGRAVASAAAGDLKALQLECGSNNPALVRADADVERTAEALVMGFTKLNGQWCERPGTVFVHAALYDALLDSVLDRIMRLRPGSCFDVDTTFGPQANRRQAQGVDDAVRRLKSQGATARAPFADRVSHGGFRSPTVVTGADPADTIDEIFGPVLVVHRVTEDAGALKLANSLEGGLAAYVFTSDIGAGMALGRRLAAGEVKLNGTSVLDLVPIRRRASGPAAVSAATATRTCSGSSPEPASWAPTSPARTLEETVTPRR